MMNKPILADEAAELLLTISNFLKEESIPLTDTLNRVLSCDIYASFPMPPFNKSPYDGYALRSEDVADASVSHPVELSITEEIQAGCAPQIEVTKGKVAKIATGAPIPEGADCTVKYEAVESDGEKVRITEPINKMENVILQGEESKQGEPLFSKGTLVTPPIQGMLAAQGFAVCQVYAKPQASLICTGSELLEPGEPIQKAKIYNSNRYSIGSYLQAFGLNCHYEGTVADELEAIADKLEEALEKSDMVITTGGASVGDYDWAVAAAQKIGANILFRKVQMKPGSSILAAEKDGKLILSLSGNPGAAVMSMIKIGLPFIRRLCGRSDLYPKTIEVTLKYPVMKKSPVLRLLCGTLEIEDDSVLFAARNVQGNGAISSFYNCNLIGEIPAGSGVVLAGTKIKAICFME